MTRRTRALVWMLCGLAWIVFLVRVVLPAARNPNTNGFAAHYTYARVLIEDHRELPQLHDDTRIQARIDELFQHHVLDHIWGQPPTMTLLLAPFAWLAPAPARAVWTAFSVLLWIVGLGILLNALRIETPGIPALAPISALSTLYMPLTDNLRRGQAYVLLYFLLCLVVSSLVRARDGRRWAAGVPLAFMVLLKSAGLWLWPLLVLARRGRVVLAAIATVLLVAAVCSPLLGWDLWRSYLFVDSRWLASNPGSLVSANQTVVSLTGHLFVFDATWNPGPVAHLPHLARALALLITATALVATVRLQRLTSADFEDRTLSVGLFVSLIVSLAPLGEGYHYLLVFPAVLIAFRWALRGQPRRRSLAFVAVCAALISVPQKYYGSSHVQAGWWALLAYPRVYGAFGLWAWLGHSLRHAPSRASAALDPPSRVN